MSFWFSERQGASGRDIDQDRAELCRARACFGFFREAWISGNALDTLFRELDRAVSEAGWISRSGRIVGASLVAALRQHSSDGEATAIKERRSANDIRFDKPVDAAQTNADAHRMIKRCKANLL